MTSNQAIYCDCCGSEKMAEVVEGKLVIKVTRHGEKHMAIIPIKWLLDKIDKRVYSEV